jgi:aminoglycoside phosphotransferase (APT) family kinase protein
MYPAEKISQEIAVMGFIREKTSIPVPKIIVSGRTEGCFAGLGPFIIMEFVNGERLDEALYQNDKIKPGIGQSTLDYIYKQMAQISGIV